LLIQSDIPFYENIDQTVTRVQRARMMEENPVSHLKIQQGFEIAKETYAACGVDVEARDCPCGRNPGVHALLAG
jgi:outer membrane protein assembly factor BamD (BamD/ComL family)